MIIMIIINKWILRWTWCLTHVQIHLMHFDRAHTTWLFAWTRGWYLSPETVFVCCCYRLHIIMFYAKRPNPFFICYSHVFGTAQSAWYLLQLDCVMVDQPQKLSAQHNCNISLSKLIKVTQFSQRLLLNCHIMWPRAATQNMCLSLMVLNYECGVYDCV